MSNVEDRLRSLRLHADASVRRGAVLEAAARAERSACLWRWYWILGFGTAALLLAVNARVEDARPVPAPRECDRELEALARPLRDAGAEWRIRMAMTPRSANSLQEVP